MKTKTKFDWERIREIVKNTDKAVLTKVINSVDGHGIYAPSLFTEAGLDVAVVNAFTKKLHSGNTPKETIFDNDNNAVESMTGVYGLDLLEFIADQFGVSSWKMGRGSRAAHLTEQLTAIFNPQKEAV